jgi:hypothetical protein
MVAIIFSQIAGLWI